MAFIVKDMFSWNKYLKNADISIFGMFFANFSPIFPQYRNTLPKTFYMTSPNSLDPLKQKLKEEGE